MRLTDFPWGRGIHAFSTLAIVVCTALPFASGEGCSEVRVFMAPLMSTGCLGLALLGGATFVLLKGQYQAPCGTERTPGAIRVGDTGR